MEGSSVDKNTVTNTSQLVLDSMVQNDTVQIEGTTEHVVDATLLVDSTNTEVVLESTIIVQETQKPAMTKGTDASAHGTNKTADEDGCYTIYTKQDR